MVPHSPCAHCYICFFQWEAGKTKLILSWVLSDVTAVRNSTVWTAIIPSWGLLLAEPMTWYLCSLWICCSTFSLMYPLNTCSVIHWSVAQDSVSVCTASLALLFLSISQHGCHFSFSFLNLEAFWSSCSPSFQSNIIDLKVFYCEKGFLVSKLIHPFWMMAFLPLSGFSLSAHYWTVLASTIILCWKTSLMDLGISSVRQKRAFCILHIFILLVSFIYTTYILLFL